MSRFLQIGTTEIDIDKSFLIYANVVVMLCCIFLQLFFTFLMTGAWGIWDFAVGDILHKIKGRDELFSLATSYGPMIDLMREGNDLVLDKIEGIGRLPLSVNK